VEQGTIIEGMKIGQWEGAQRDSYRRGRLPALRIARLEAIGFKWDILPAKWLGFFSILQKIHSEGKDVNLPSGALVEGKKIGTWIGEQRALYKAGNLPAERIARLEAIGFMWEPQRQRWEESFAILLRLYKKGKDVNLPVKTVIRGKKIGQWGQWQRDTYREGTISAERIARLESIGFKWEAVVESMDQTKPEEEITSHVVVIDPAIFTAARAAIMADENPILLARRLSALIEVGVPRQALAEGVGKSQSWLSKILSLLSAPKEIQRLIESGEMAYTNYTAQRQEEWIKTKNGYVKLRS
jgi:hypothetical protein